MNLKTNPMTMTFFENRKSAQPAFRQFPSPWVLGVVFCRFSSSLWRHRGAIARLFKPFRGRFGRIGRRQSPQKLHYQPNIGVFSFFSNNCSLITADW
jgi:hypothetical protein